MDQIRDVLLIILGWLLGILSPGVADAIKRRKRRAEINAVAATELDELRFLVALVLLQVRSKLRNMDQAALDLLRPLFLNYGGDTDDAPLLAATKELLAKGDATFIALHNAPAASAGSLRPLPYDAPFLTEHLEELGLFPPLAQKRLLRVLTELRLFNEQVAFVQHAVERTFDSSLSPANYAANDANLASGTEKLATRAARLIEAIDRILGPQGRPVGLN